MEEIFVTDEQQFLNEECPFEDPPKLTDQFRCLHCGDVIRAGDHKIFKEDGDDLLYISCPNAPKCTGSVVDWIDVRAVPN